MTTAGTAPQNGWDGATAAGALASGTEGFGLAPPGSTAISSGPLQPLPCLLVARVTAMGSPHATRHIADAARPKTEVIRRNHLSNTACLTHLFFRNDEYFGKLN